jgi:pimeloyl-ACP methyl ester carboxylesterase
MVVNMKFFVKVLPLVLITINLLTISVRSQQAGNLKIEPYVFENSKKERVNAELGRLLVPENRKNPQSRLIELAFVRFKSTSSKPASPIVYLAGGPGGSGIASARGSRFPVFMAMREFGDVIALDQRGVGQSKPNLFCRETYGLPVDTPPTREEVIRITKERSRSCAEYWRGQAVDLSGYNTNENADDIEALRKAIGANKVSLWGTSYGTTLALATIKRHEKYIERAILAGIEGLDDLLKPPSYVQKHLVDINRLVKADSNLNKQIPDFLALMRMVLERLEKEPVTVETTDPKTKQKVKVIINKYVMQLLTASAIGTDNIAAFPRLYLAASKSDFSEITPQWLNLSSSSIGSAMAYMTDCSSGASPELRGRIQREIKGTLLGNAADIVFPDICDAWNSLDLGKDFRAPVKSKVPVLFISGTLDGRTPVSNAVKVGKGFRNGKYLIIEGAWHGDPLFVSSPKIKDVMMEFMTGVPLSTNKIILQSPKFAPLKL